MIPSEGLMGKPWPFFVEREVTMAAQVKILGQKPVAVNG
jgi:hypothetical protein